MVDSFETPSNLLANIDRKIGLPYKRTFKQKHGLVMFITKTVVCRLACLILFFVKKLNCFLHHILEHT